ncbi:PIG-L deacetylase family protein [Paenibacillus sacheonensis]|uniref:PIG-L family deacetylase n=1 Tax=Paenibacillus sacheonensis TaxID=742054 RepID=A0A7X4YRT7_9BACL|nr:PIG-L deacetylase family protein [Paenibacillus sacheonensis]MBM7566186.1 LmbE family N-acetylglucosaminyl deacetylase [Paenibacillus sacheonensis]NBC70394.1 PIG-L family deacetylase [Paenibacillus sacheonensis]
MNVLAICAHPDDAEIWCGGTLAKYANRGDKVTIAIATNGEVGSATHTKEEIAEIRKGESIAAAKVIGADLLWLGYRDEFFFDSEDARLAFIEAMRASRADVVLTHWPEDLYNPDHTITGRMANDVAIMTTVPNIKTASPPLAKIPIVYFIESVAGLGFQPEEYVDITDTFEAKKEMLAEHKSQIGDWLQDQYGSNAMEMIEITSRFRGIQCGVLYAEGFIRAKAYPRNIAGSLLP